MNVARFLLRDGNKVGAEVSLEGLEIFNYEDQKGQEIHALATVKAEREFHRQVLSKLLLLYVRWSRPSPRPLDRTEMNSRSFPGETIARRPSKLVPPPPLSGWGPSRGASVVALSIRA